MQLTNISGNFGEGIVASTDSLHHVIWNIGEQYPNVFFEDVIIKIVAESTINTETPFEMVSIPSGSFDNCGTEDEINYSFVSV